MTMIPTVIGALGTVIKWLVQGMEDLGKRRTSGDYPNDSIVEIDPNTE